MKKRSYYHYLVFLFLFLLASCATTNKLDNDLAKNSVPYLIEENLEFPPENSEDGQKTKYLFFRLYNPYYKNPLYVANFLKAGIAITEINPEITSHSAINFYLDDSFYGLTMFGDMKLSQESCTNTKNHVYMSKSNVKKSTQMTFALPVTEEEYNNAKEFVETYSLTPEITYSGMQNFKIALFDINRKFFTPKKKQKFGNGDYEPLPKNKPKYNTKDYIEYDFVCSTFIAFVLINNVPRIAEWFEEHNINYRYVNVGDLIHIPGMIRLFSSTWEYYEIAAQAFVDMYPQFDVYLNK
ncbi:MAG: hypothetical protein K5681_07835 [Treponema sp.]|nr:hypothetical protein [Treponema sp.]